MASMETQSADLRIMPPLLTFDMHLFNLSSLKWSTTAQSAKRVKAVANARSRYVGPQFSQRISLIICF
jgi:hypothetical protein